MRANLILLVAGIAAAYMVAGASPVFSGETLRLNLNVEPISKEAARTGSLPVSCRVFDAEAAGGKVWEERHYASPSADGYVIDIGAGIETRAVRTNQFPSTSDLWFELEIDGDVLHPRIPANRIAEPFSAQGEIYRANVALPAEDASRDPLETATLVLGPQIEAGTVFDASGQGIVLGGETRTTWPSGGADNLGDHIATQNIEMGGNKIVGLGAPETDTDAATKLYVDLNAGTDNLGNHTAAQDLNMNGFKISGLAAPGANADAATKLYVDLHAGTDNLGNHTATRDFIEGERLNRSVRLGCLRKARRDCAGYCRRTCIPREDGHAREQPLLKFVLPTLGEDAVMVAGRNCCVRFSVGNQSL